MELIAHRGASFDAPENTLPAVQLAWEQQADAVEVDVHISKDHRVTVIHDPDTRRTTGRSNRVLETSFDGLQTLDAGRWKARRWRGTPIPALEEIIATIPPGRRLFIEVKFPDHLTAPFTDLCRSVDPAKIVPIGFSLPAMRAIKRALPGVEVALVAEFKRSGLNREWRPTVETFIGQARDAGLDSLDLNAGGPVDRPLIDQVRRHGLKCYVWTVDSEQRARELVRDGIDGITTNRPGWLREKLGLHGARDTTGEAGP